MAKFPPKRRALLTLQPEALAVFIRETQKEPKQEAVLERPLGACPRNCEWCSKASANKRPGHGHHYCNTCHQIMNA